MNVPLKPELERFVEEQVKAGRFSSASDVIEAGLARLMLDPVSNVDELDDADVSSIEASERQIAKGKDLDWKEVSSQLRREYLGQ
jgi:putative addiction module CopG family antidote